MAPSEQDRVGGQERRVEVNVTEKPLAVEELGPIATRSRR